jgi:hypothetical protein
MISYTGSIGSVPAGSLDDGTVFETKNGNKFIKIRDHSHPYRWVQHVDGYIPQFPGPNYARQR